MCRRTCAPLLAFRDYVTGLNCKDLAGAKAGPLAGFEAARVFQASRNTGESSGPRGNRTGPEAGADERATLEKSASSVSWTGWPDDPSSAQNPPQSPATARQSGNGSRADDDEEGER